MIIERRTPADSADPWEMEVTFDYNPSDLLMDDAIDMRPKIDFTIRALRSTGDFLDAWIKARMDEYLKTIEREKR